MKRLVLKCVLSFRLRKRPGTPKMSPRKLRRVAIQWVQWVTCALRDLRKATPDWVSPPPPTHPPTPCRPPPRAPSVPALRTWHSQRLAPAASRVFFFGRAAWLFCSFSLCGGGSSGFVRPGLLGASGSAAVVLLLSLCHRVVGSTCSVAFLGPSSRDARRGRHSPRLRAPTLSTTSLRTAAPVMAANN